MSGKTADVVMTVKNGQQIIRKYQPVVLNPKSAAQIESRAKLKLLSQLSAAMASVIAIPREGMVSGRNIFTRINYGLTSFSNNEADINLSRVQLTNSQRALPAISATRVTDHITAYISDAAANPVSGVDMVVYAMFTKTAQSKLQYAGSAVATEAGAQGGWTVSLPLVNQEVVIYAYGVKSNDVLASVNFGDMEAAAAETVAKLAVTAITSNSNNYVTRTSGFTLTAAA